MNEQPVRSHSLGPLIVAQFFGAFNDNAWKLIVITLGLGLITMSVGGTPDILEQQWVATLAFVVFSVPMVLFSLPAGALADQVSKRSVIVGTKALELVLMLAAFFVLLLLKDNLTAMLVVLGLMGVQSALFSPAKYGLLPELLPHEKLSEGNGLLEMWTMLAIITGTGLGTVLLDPQQPWIAVLPLVLMGVAGLAASLRIPCLPPALGSAGTSKPARGIVETVQAGWRVMREDRIVWLTVMGQIIYWSLISLLGQNLIIYTYQQTQGFAHQEKLTGVPLGIFGLGVALGAIASGRLSGGKVEFGLIPLGAFVFFFFTLLLGLLDPAWPGFWGTLVLMPFLGAACGLVAIPLNAILQWRSPPDRRGAVIALTNVFVLLGTAAGSIGAFLLALNGFDPSGIFLASALALLAATFWSIWLLPESLVRLVLILLTNSIYRLKVAGRENIPETSGVLLMPNHVSLVDSLILMATLDRPVRLIVREETLKIWWLRPFLKALRTIPVASASEPKEMLRALREVGELLDQGEVVCIFPEGQVTRTGMLLPFREEAERILKGRNAMIVPVYLDRLWGSVFSHAGGRIFWKWPKEVPYRVHVRFGAPLPPTSPIREVRNAVHELSEGAWRERMTGRPPLHHTLIRSLRRRPWTFAFGDERQPRVSRQRALTGAIALARALQADWKDQPRVGIMLPPSVPGALVNFAAAMSGRTSVNLNYTTGQAGLESAARQAELKTVVTSRLFLEKANIKLPENVQPIWLEEVARRITFGLRFSSALLALFATARQIERGCGASKPVHHDDIITIIFSSGSTGEPKGVQLSHANLDANVEGCIQVFPLESDDRLLGILPLFHSFGYMLTWMAANHGVGVFFHPNPLDAASIGNLVAKHRLTILSTTPTFLQLYLKRVAPGQFGSLRFVLTAAEKLPHRVAEAFEATFGIRPIEGYGSTECSPVVTVSTLSYRGKGVFQCGSRTGSVGHALPGVLLKLVDPETFEPLPKEEDTEGLLLVKGPNVMRGYLGKPELDAQVLRDGWYVTGDLASIDEDGFVRIMDRLSRFSKIGGEMVPHGRIEDALQEAAGEELQIFAVTGVPDEKKGERLAVLHTLDEQRIPTILEKLAKSGLPNLFIPRADQFIKVGQLPVLGTGKIDLRALKKIALEKLGTSQ